MSCRGVRRVIPIVLRFPSRVSGKIEVPWHLLGDVGDTNGEGVILVLRCVVEVGDPVGIGTSMKGGVGFQTCGVCPTTECITHLMVFARYISDRQIELAKKFMPSAALAYRSNHLI